MSFASSREIRLMKRDFEKTLTSAEGCGVTLRYYMLDGDGSLHNAPVTVAARAMQAIVKPRDLKTLPDRIVEVGDCVFYFSTTLNLAEPQAGLPVADTTLKVIDSAGLVWSPKTIDKDDIARFLTFNLMSTQIGQAMICVLEK